ncbi:MAG: hypothetical protein N2663_01925 [Chlorobi bacterium]|nr:hypothetical protein [Chlorobiota bacterium]
MNKHTIVLPDELKNLRSRRGYPLVTIAMPTHRTFPENRQDPIRFKDLVRQVRDRLSRELSKREVANINEQLATIAERIDWAHALDGLVVFVGDGIERVVYLPVTVRERAIIDETFATRDLVVAQSKLLHYWVLVLSTDRTRLLEGYGNHLVEVISDHFPLHYDGPRSGDPDNPLPGGFGKDPSKYRDEQYRNYFRAVDQALRHTIGMQHPPVAIIGVERNRSYFAEVRSQHYEIIAELDGSMTEATLHQIAEYIAPTLEEYLERRAITTINEFSRAIAAGLYTCSITDMWHFSRQGRADLLIVEHGYTVAGRWDTEHRIFTPVDDPREPDIIDDVVDDIIEATLDHHGHVAFVPPQSLSPCKHIAMTLRY